MEHALERLEIMTREENLMTGAEILKAVHGVDNKVGCTLQGVIDMLQGVDDRVKAIGDKVILKSAQIVHLPTTTVLTVNVVRCMV